MKAVKTFRKLLKMFEEFERSDLNGDAIHAFNSISHWGIKCVQLLEKKLNQIFQEETFPHLSFKKIPF